MNFLLQNFGFVWLGIMIIFLFFEAATTALMTVWFALGALAAAVTSFFTDNIAVQAVVFFVVSVAALLCLRPLLKHQKKKTVPTNADAVIGKTAIVTKEINNIRNEGELYIDGKVWSARSETDEVIPVDTTVVIVRIEGVKLIVKRA